jgi:DNA repair protein RecN (Recombination protein N)
MPQAPIDKIASGGELSRFMLAFRTALFDKTTQKTIIFDEVDVGISGSVADAVGQRLKTLSKVAQVIVITHQPQVAGKANQHILVEKTQMTANTLVTAHSLNREERPRELARMISGKEITANSLAAAKELM